jgi:hypothetical protein
VESYPLDFSFEIESKPILHIRRIINQSHAHDGESKITMTTSTLRERLAQSQPILADGATGTLLHQRGTAMNACFDALNLTAPDVVVQMHG